MPTPVKNEARLALDSRCTLGEGIVWDERVGALREPREDAAEEAVFADVAEGLHASAQRAVQRA